MYSDRRSGQSDCDPVPVTDVTHSHCERDPSVTVSPPPACGSSHLEVTTAVKVQNNVISIDRIAGSQGSAPVWANQDTGGASLNADPTLPPSDVPLNFAVILISFNGSLPQKAVPVKFTLLNETRQEHTTSQVEVTVSGSDASSTFVLGPSTTVRFTPNGANIFIQWLSPGPYVNYSNRFILVVDAGCAYRQSEFWLDVWNWS